MNYRHAYHAGGVADIFKHVVLLALLDHLRRKETPFFVLDTHAGAGSYDLAGPEARKTAESDGGAGLLWAASPATQPLQALQAAMAALNPDGVLRHYPGSPLLIVRGLRAQDQGAFCELRREEAEKLRRTLHPTGGVHARDGYEALRGLLPPQAKRGLVLIDPPFEAADEFERAADAITRNHARFATAIWAFWHPVKERPAIWRFQETMMEAALPRQLSIEFLTTRETDSRILNGSAMHLVGAPHGFGEALGPVLAELHGLLADSGEVKIREM